MAVIDESTTPHPLPPPPRLAEGAEKNSSNLVREQRTRQKYTSTICAALFAQALLARSFQRREI